MGWPVRKAEVVAEYLSPIQSGYGIQSKFQHANPVIHLAEPQVWVLIGALAAAFFSMIGIVSSNFNRTMSARFETMDARFAAMDARFESMRTEMNSKFEVINVKLENMHHDIQALSCPVFGTDPR